MVTHRSRKLVDVFFSPVFCPLSWGLSDLDCCFVHDSWQNDCLHTLMLACTAQYWLRETLVGRRYNYLQRDYCFHVVTVTDNFLMVFCDISGSFIMTTTGWFILIPLLILFYSPSIYWILHQLIKKKYQTSLGNVTNYYNIIGTG